LIVALCVGGFALLLASVWSSRSKADGYTSILNGRFKGGWTTRHYGRPAENLHAIQMELAQSTYLASETPPWSYDPSRVDRLRRHLTSILESLSDWRPQ